MFAENICVTDDLIREKAERVIENLNQSKPEKEKIDINLSNG